MNQCPVCGRQRQGDHKKCPNCDVFYSAIDEFLAEEEAKEERDWLRTRCKRIFAATDRKAALAQEWHEYTQTLPKGSGFVLYVIIAFVFMLVLIVL